MRALSSAGFQRLQQRRTRFIRRLKSQPPGVHYFHQVDDPYSHLAVQKLEQLRDAYRLPFIVHLAGKPEPAYLGSAEHFDHWALRDVSSIARAYGTDFPASPKVPGPAAVSAANALLAEHLEQPDFAHVAYSVGEQLWNGQSAHGVGENAAGTRAIKAGNALRHKLGHYLGGMFYFDGEWYWGVDRLRLLEQRLIDEGQATGTPNLCVPEPTATDTAGLNASHVALEYFPSLRSPYTAIGHRRVLDLIDRSGITVTLRPVLPMLMRGVPAPPAKQRYIVADAGREGRAHGSPFGKITDPFGDPVERAFALFPGAVALGKGMDFVSAYLSAAWVQGIDITAEGGLRQVAANANIDWAELNEARRDTHWEKTLNENLDELLGAGLWGVPSFRVTGGNTATPFTCWGQDRIWRVENEISDRA